MAQPFDKTCAICGRPASACYEFTPGHGVLHLCPDHYKYLVVDHEARLKREVRKGNRSSGRRPR